MKKHICLICSCFFVCGCTTINKTENSKTTDNTTEILVDKEINKSDIIKVEKHGDHYHVKTKDGKEHLIYNEKLVEDFHIEEHEHLEDEVPVLAVKHGSHWHLFTDFDKTKEIGETDGNPKELYPNIKIEE